MGDPAIRVGVTEAEYLAFERDAGERHEFADGEIFAMAGSSLQHSLLATNFTGELRAALRGRCQVHGSDLRIFIPSTRRYTYADAVVVCGRPEFSDEREDAVMNPRLIVEVLSDSTEKYDRGKKFENYASLASLEHYVLARQDEARVEHFERREGGWFLRAFGPRDLVRVASLDLELRVEALYEGVFDAAASA